MKESRTLKINSIKDDELDIELSLLWDNLLTSEKATLELIGFSPIKTGLNTN